MTVKKWYFSTDGKVTEPMSLEEAQSFAQENPDVYGWHPSFTQWKPVSIIKELGDIVSEAKPSIHLLTELVEKFKIKKQRLDKKLSVIEQRIEVNENLLTTLHEEIAQYKKLTANLSDGVKGAINSIEQQYLSLQEKQSRLHEASSISMMEIETLVNEFNERVAGKSAGVAASSGQVEKKVVQAKSKQREQSADAFLEEQINEAPLRAVNAEQEIVDVDAEHEAPTTQTRKRKVKLVEVNALQEESVEPVAEASQPAETPESIEQFEDDSDDKKGFTGMKSLIKSVFKGEEGSEEGQENSLSKLLAMEEAEEEKRAVELQAESSNDEQDKPARRRTRRRR